MTTCPIPKCKITVLEQNDMTVRVKVDFEPSGIPGEWGLWGDHPLLDWGDGTSQPVSNFAYEKTYDAPGERVISLTGANACGRTCKCSIIVFKSGDIEKDTVTVFKTFVVAAVVMYVITKLMWR